MRVSCFPRLALDEPPTIVRSCRRSTFDSTALPPRCPRRPVSGSGSLRRRVQTLRRRRRKRAKRKAVSLMKFSAVLRPPLSRFTLFIPELRGQSASPRPIGCAFHRQEQSCYAVAEIFGKVILAIAATLHRHPWGSHPYVSWGRPGQSPRRSLPACARYWRAPASTG